MTKPRGVWVWALLLCWLITGVASEAWGARRRYYRRSARTEEKAKEKTPEPPAEPATVAPAGLKPPVAEEPETFLSWAHEQEAAGDISGAMQTLSKFINLFPRHAERGATIFRMAQLAGKNQRGHQAIPIYYLAAALYPDTQMAADARWQALNLEFYQALRKSEFLAAFKDYLKRLAPLPPGVTTEKLREPIRQGWQVVERAVREKSPCPVNLVEEALALWELHPEGTQPPEAALLLGELLQEKGLYGEARSYLTRAREQGSPEVRTQALVGLLEGAWASRDLPDFAGAWMLWRQNHGEITPVFKSRLEKLPLPEGFFSEAPPPGQGGKPEEDALAALLDFWSGKTPDGSRQAALLRCLEHFLSRSLPQAVRERLQLQLAHLKWTQGNFPQAARIYQQLLAANGKGENSAFYQDRLALTQLKGRHPEAAMEIYRGLNQGEDGFWQLLSRTRIADVELGRLQTEPPQ